MGNLESLKNVRNRSRPQAANGSGDAGVGQIDVDEDEHPSRKRGLAKIYSALTVGNLLSLRPTVSMPRSWSSPTATSGSAVVRHHQNYPASTSYPSSAPTNHNSNSVRGTSRATYDGLGYDPLTAVSIRPVPAPLPPLPPIFHDPSRSGTSPAELMVVPSTPFARYRGPTYLLNGVAYPEDPGLQPPPLVMPGQYPPPPPPSYNYRQKNQ